MNPFIKRFCFATLLAVTLPVFAQYTPPTDNELDEVLANPKLITAVLQGASGAEAADVLFRIIEIVVESKLGPLQQKYLISYWTARITELLPNAELVAFSDAIVLLTPADLLQYVFAGMSIGGAGNSDFIDLIQEMAGDVELLQNAILRPETVLTLPVYNLLISTIQSGQTLPPPPNITTPIIPPGVVEQATPPPPQPPVPDTYDGQG